MDNDEINLGGYPKQRAIPKTSTAVLTSIYMLAIGAFVTYLGVGLFRNTQASAVARWLMPLIGILALGYGVYLALQIPAARQLDKEGVTVEGEVIAKWQHRSRNGRTCYIGFAFRPQSMVGSYTPEGSDGLYTARQTIGWGWWRKLEVGNPVTVRYLPEEPQKSRIEREAS